MVRSRTKAAYAYRPIGVFDSGMGGLTVVNALGSVMPGEDIIYFGDTAHVPYGTKSQETVKRFSMEIAEFLIEKKIKCLVVACNTASSLALSYLCRALPVPVIGVVEPGVRHALINTRSGRVGVIGTEATVKSGSYDAAFRRLSRKAVVESVACPLFISLIEEGFTGGPMIEYAIRLYLNPLKKKKIDVLILGCTHFPLIRKPIERFMGRGVTVIDSASSVAQEVRQVLTVKRWLCGGTCGHGRVRFYVSDDAKRFKRIGNRLFKRLISHVSQVRL